MKYPRQKCKKNNNNINKPQVRTDFSQPLEPHRQDDQLKRRRRAEKHGVFLHPLGRNPSGDFNERQADSETQRISNHSNCKCLDYLRLLNKNLSFLYYLYEIIQLETNYGDIFYTVDGSDAPRMLFYYFQVSNSRSSTIIFFSGRNPPCTVLFDTCTFINDGALKNVKKNPTKQKNQNFRTFTFVIFRQSC